MISEEKIEDIINFIVKNKTITFNNLLNKVNNNFNVGLNEYKKTYIEKEVFPTNINKSNFYNSEKKISNSFADLVMIDIQIGNLIRLIEKALKGEDNLLISSKKYNKELHNEENKLLMSDNSSLPRYFDKLYDLRYEQVKMGFLISGILLFTGVFYNHIKKVE